MPTDHLTPQPSGNLSKIDLAALDGVIQEFLGLGLACSQWPAEVMRRGYEWFPGLKNIIIRKEWEFFKQEIQLLKSQPEIAQSSRSNSNSLASILKRLKGEPWLEGQPDELGKRLRERRLLGRDAKIRCLQNYVRDWGQESANSASPSSVQIATAKPTTNEAPSYPRAPEDLAIETKPPDGIDEMCNFDANLAPGSQIAGPPPGIETSGHYIEPELVEDLLKPSPTSSCHTTMDFPLIREEAVPISSSQGFPLSKPEPNYLNLMEQYPVSEIFGAAEIEAWRPDHAFQGTSEAHNSVDESSSVALKMTDFHKTGLITKERPKTGPQFISPPRKRCKRRHQDTTRTSFEKPGYGNATPATGDSISDSDTIMSGYESGSQHTNELASQLLSTQIAPPSGPLPSLPYPRVISEPTFTNFRTHIELEQELQQESQRTRRELISIRKQLQKDQETFARKLRARDAEISDLNKLVEELRLSNEQYFQQIVELTDKNMILKEANSRMKTASSFSTGLKERGHSIQPPQTFPQSKNPCRLSLTHRPAPASKPSSPPQKLSTLNLQAISTSGMPIATSSSDNNQDSSGHPVPESSPSKPFNQHHHHRSEDSIAGPNPSLSTRRDPIQNLVHKFSNQFLRQPKQSRDESSRAGPVPFIPPLAVSVPLNRQMAAVLVDGDKRLTNDSGYDSLQFETSSRESMADFD